jgi:hypothetical protein
MAGSAIGEIKVKEVSDIARDTLAKQLSFAE